MDQAKLPSISVVAVEVDVILVDAQGQSRALNSGEFVGSGDVVVTPANGSFSVNTDENQSHSVAGDSAVFFNFDPQEDGLVLAEVDVGDQSDAIDVIQQLIVEGRDPTELLEESAAGEPVLSSGFSPFINIARSTRFVLAEAGYDTSVDGIAAPAVLIPGLLDTVTWARGESIKIGANTGYAETMIEGLVASAAKQSYVPDSIVCATQVPKGRPYPHMSLKNAMELDVQNLAACVKIDDTLPGIDEGLNAGMWTIGLAVSGNEVGLSH